VATDNRGHVVSWTLSDDVFKNPSVQQTQVPIMMFLMNLTGVHVKVDLGDICICVDSLQKLQPS